MYSMIFSVTTFDILPTQDFEKLLFDFSNNYPLSDEFEALDIFLILSYFQIILTI